VASSPVLQSSDVEWNVYLVFSSFGLCHCRPIIEVTGLFLLTAWICATHYVNSLRSSRTIVQTFTLLSLLSFSLLNSTVYQQTNRLNNIWQKKYYNVEPSSGDNTSSIKWSALWIDFEHWGYLIWRYWLAFADDSSAVICSVLLGFHYCQTMMTAGDRQRRWRKE
jgi:hypothetical protein